MNATPYNKSVIRSKETIDLLTRVPMFDALDYKETRTISRYLGVVKFEAGEVLFNEGDRGDRVLFVITGSLEVLKSSPGGRDVAIAELGRGRSIGEMSLVDDYPRSATVRAVARTFLVVLTRERFDTLVREHPEVGVKVLKGIARQVSLNLRKTSSRLAEYMLPLE